MKLMPGEIYPEEQSPQYMSTQEQCRLWRVKGCQKQNSAPTSSLNLPSTQQLGPGTMCARTHTHTHIRVYTYMRPSLCLR